MEAESNQSYNIKTTVFEGPFELLLNLIEKRKLFINDISLGEVAKDYISFISQMPKIDIDHTTHFISVATTLMLIKSRSLLPSFELTDDEEEDVKNLEQRLVLYKLIQEVGIEIKEQYGKQIIFFPPETRDFGAVWSPDTQVTQEIVLASILGVISALPQEAEKRPEIEMKKVMSIDEMMGNLAKRIEVAVSMSFREFSKGIKKFESQKEEKIHMVVGFLAMLELIREGLLDAIQDNEFEDITITKQTNVVETEGLAVE